jgi:S-adenosylmethionine/arginine decarboxylase-like enzyme
MDTQSQHLLADIWLEGQLTQNHIDHLKKVVEKNLTVVERVEHKFTPHGETIVFILSESHFSIHTYPEENYLSLDLYICNMSTDLEDILSQMTSPLPVLKIEKQIIGRGIRPAELESTLERNKLLSLYFLTFFTAFCSIIYELLLAQTLATTMGDTLLRYNITIGLYIASMGMGALLYGKFNQKYQITNLIRIELLISLVGGLAPISVLILDSMFQSLSFNGLTPVTFHNFQSTSLTTE